MSKSLGNLVMVRDLLERHTPDALRLYLADHHYRQPWEHDEQELEAAAELAQQLTSATKKPSGDGERFDATWAQSNFVEAMNDDLDTPRATEALEEFAEAILETEGQDLREAQGMLGQLALIFGLRLGGSKPEDRVLRGWREHRKKFTDDES